VAVVFDRVSAFSERIGACDDDQACGRQVLPTPLERMTIASELTAAIGGNKARKLNWQTVFLN
jgi:hypothetical protein